MSEYLVFSLNGGGPRLARFAGVPVHAPHRDGLGTGTRATHSILVVEDDFLVSLELEAVLLKAGFAVAGIAASADEAWEIARSAKPDLVVMDIRLSGAQDGIDAAVKLFRELGIRSLFASAHVDSGSQERAQAARPLGWVAKPYRSDTLIQAVRRAVQSLDKS